MNTARRTGRGWPGFAAGPLRGRRDAVMARLRETAGALGVEEVVVLTTLHDAAVRRRSYALLAEAAGLPGVARPGVDLPAIAAE